MLHKFHPFLFASIYVSFLFSTDRPATANAASRVTPFHAGAASASASNSRSASSSQHSADALFNPRAKSALLHSQPFFALSTAASDRRKQSSQTDKPRFGRCETFFGRHHSIYAVVAGFLRPQFCTSILSYVLIHAHCVCQFLCRDFFVLPLFSPLYHQKPVRPIGSAPARWRCCGCCRCSAWSALRSSLSAHAWSERYGCVSAVKLVVFQTNSFSF